MTIDNCPAHPNIENLTNGTLKNVYHQIQHQIYNQGIIKIFEAFYRKLLLMNVISKSDITTLQAISHVASKINVIDVVL